ncbi:Hint domain-containing protein [Roseicyclus sp. F158]|uniref:Hint domain-containing protein n=1 Tax=Tropicimonas omnivorans TaxID=3075590 RepID=A0ABU3DFS1_9RHOB|nr:Hint domain-containing protein [Roseicyclus sp. F158]MDT0682555.1 Hint domain-containing protein [Roseicyclus sp. F158]
MERARAEQGAYVVPWARTETAGLPGGPVADILPGETWRWDGIPSRIDARGGPLLLTGARGDEEMNARAGRAAGRMARRLGLAARDAATAPEPKGAEPGALGLTFVVTDGRCAWQGAWVPGGPRGKGLVLFDDGVPPSGTDLHVVRSDVCPRRRARDRAAPSAEGLICFVPGTSIATPGGSRPVEALRPGDLVLTKDDGPRPVLWTGARHLSGARLRVMPHLRPIRVRSGALGIERPEGDLLVSPRHRLLLAGPAARALFNQSEVLVHAEDLLGHAGISTDIAARDVSYVHVLMERHQVLFANGVESESFHPDEAAIGALGDADRARIRHVLAGENLDAYGPPARRVLGRAEAAILMAGTARLHA